ncbi:MAG: hypothetical protein M3Q56_10400, partial [Bacteroidota bacterium]|nr:hypothetical protein [Bacteroidota bacterium]
EGEIVYLVYHSIKKKGELVDSTILTEMESFSNSTELRNIEKFKQELNNSRIIIQKSSPPSSTYQENIETKEMIIIDQSGIN